MKPSTYFANSAVMVFAALSLLFVPGFAAPMDLEDEQADNSLMGRSESDVGLPGSWDAIDTAALRKMLLQIDAEDGLNRVSRSWPVSAPRGWGLRGTDGRLARPWRADKRQVRFRQCYFNPISCFRK